MILKVLSWNSWAGKNLEKATAFLSKTDADIIGLQEVLERDKQNNAEDIAKKLGLNYFYCQAFTDDRHNVPTYHLGNAILTKFTIEKSFCNELSSLELYQKTSETEPRTAAEVDLSVNGKSLNFFSAHLAHSPRLRPSKMRDIQLNNLLKHLPNQLTILMGDFNSLPDSEVIKKLEEKLINTDKDSSGTTAVDDDEHGKFNFRKDYIFVSPDITVKSFKILDSDASDHLPILAEIEI